MELAHRWSDRNLTRMELVMALLILSVMIGYFSHHMYSVFGKVEKSMIDRTLININSALNYHASFAIMNQDIETLNQMVSMNPMTLMTNNFGLAENSSDDLDINVIVANSISKAPSNYGGTVIDDSDTNLDSGQWYFDQDDSLLFYKLNNAEFFTSDIEGPPRVRYKVNLNFIDQDGDKLFNPLIDEFTSLKLDAVDHFEWSF